MNPVWEFESRDGTLARGEMIGFYDFGGTDVGYTFRRADGSTEIVSGARLKKARRIWDAEAKAN